MSLKAFHLFFIAASVIVALGFGVWSLRAFATGGQAGYLWMGLASLALGVGLVFYGRRFRQKFRDHPSW